MEFWIVYYRFFLICFRGLGLGLLVFLVVEKFCRGGVLSGVLWILSSYLVFSVVVVEVLNMVGFVLLGRGSEKEGE